MVFELSLKDGDYYFIKVKWTSGGHEVFCYIKMNMVRGKLIVHESREAQGGPARLLFEATAQDISYHSSDEVACIRRNLCALLASLESQRSALSANVEELKRRYDEMFPPKEALTK